MVRSHKYVRPFDEPPKVSSRTPPQRLRGTRVYIMCLHVRQSPTLGEWPRPPGSQERPRVCGGRRGRRRASRADPTTREWTLGPAVPSGLRGRGSPGERAARPVPVRVSPCRSRTPASSTHSSRNPTSSTAKPAEPQSPPMRSCAERDLLGNGVTHTLPRGIRRREIGGRLDACAETNGGRRVPSLRVEWVLGDLPRGTRTAQLPRRRGSRLVPGTTRHAPCIRSGDSSPRKEIAT